MIETATLRPTEPNNMTKCIAAKFARHRESLPRWAGHDSVHHELPRPAILSRLPSTPGRVTLSAWLVCNLSSWYYVARPRSGGLFFGKLRLERMQHSCAVPHAPGLKRLQVAVGVLVGLTVLALFSVLWQR